jgi:hypothetical protein
MRCYSGEKIMNAKIAERLFVSRFFFIVVSVVIVNSAHAANDQYIKNWAYYRDITLNTTSSGAGITADQIDFPMLVRLGSADSLVFKQAKTGGADIRFAKVSSGSLGSHLPYHVELWDSTNRSAVIWVKMDTVKGNSSDQQIRMLWGYSSAADSSRPSVVFDTANGFRAVWHLSEEASGKGSVGLYKDVTRDSCNGNDSISSTGRDGIIGYGHNFNSDSSDYIPTSKYVTNFAQGKFTLSLWAKLTDTLGGAILYKGSKSIKDSTAWTYGQSAFYFGDTTRGKNSKGVYPNLVGCSNDFIISSTKFPVDSNWHHLTYIWNNNDTSAKAIYIDGSKVQLYKSYYYPTRTDTTTNVVLIGRQNYWETRRTFAGSMDELEISNVVRDSNWIKLCYKTQASSSSVISLGQISYNVPVITYKSQSITAVTGTAITPDTATSTGSTVMSWSVSPALPTGLTFDTLTGIISGTPTVATTATPYVITATNSAGSGKDTVTITITAAVVAPVITYKNQSISGVTGTGITPDTATVTGSAVTLWSVSPTLSAGLTFDTLTGIISGTPTVATTATPYVITATNSAGSGKDTVTITITETVTVPVISYKYDTIKGIAGTAITADTPSVTGIVDSFTIAPVLPAGLSIDKTTGIISGTATSANASAVYIITAVNSAGVAADTVTIAVTVAVDKFSIAYRNQSISGVIGKAITADTATVTGGKVVKWTMDTVLPTGLAFDTLTGIISGTPAVISAVRNYVVTAKDSGGTVAKDTVSVEVTDSAALVNRLKLTSAVFDSTTNTIRVTWKNDSTQTSGYTIGISYSLGGYAKDTTAVKTIRKTLTISSSSTMSYALNISDSLVFDTTYYIGLWLRRGTGGSWSIPTDSSRDTVRTPSAYTWQKVTYFRLNDSTDTVYAFNGRIRLTNDIPIDPTSDTLYNWTSSEAARDGFIPVSTGFYFKVRNQTSSFYIGVKYDSLPQGHSRHEIRMYRYHSGAGWYVDTGSCLDSAAGIVYVKTKDLTYPFIAMIDTISPKVAFVGVSDSMAAPSAQDILDTFVVHDNIMNSICEFKYAKGGDGYAAGSNDTLTLSDTTATLGYIISAGMVSEDNGVRAIFVASDGVHRDTTNVSRRVVRSSKSDMLVTTAQQWHPLHVTAEPDSPYTSNALHNLWEQGVWKYDATQFRLFRWYSYSGNADSISKWVEYTDSLGSVFTFTPGEVMWLKTRNQVSVDFGRAVTLSMQVPYEIKLRPHGWTDIAQPYRFNVYMEDILDATGAAGVDTDSLEFYLWKQDTAGQYYAAVSYIKGIVEADTMLYGDNTAYGVYNSSGDTIVLTIPPIPLSMSKRAGAVTTAWKHESGKVTQTHAASSAGKGSAGRWLLKISGRISGSNELSPVYCGYSGGTVSNVRMYHAPAQRGSVAMGVCDAEKNFYGHELAGGTLSDGGMVYELAFVNSGSAAATVEYTIGNVDSLPGTMQAMLIDPVTGNSEVVYSDKTYSVNTGAKHKSYMEVAVGTPEYLSKMKTASMIWQLDLTGVYPNPFSRSVRITYSLPSAGVKNVEVSIVNVFGRVLYEKTFSAGGSGMREVVWNGRDAGGRHIASGIYFVKLTALDDRACVKGVFEKKITYLP